MEPIILNNIPDEVFLDDIKELTQEFPIEFPNLFKQIKDYLNVDTQNIYITDFVEDENNSDYFYGYLFDILSRKMYKYSFEKDKSKFEEVNISSLTLKNTFSIKVLHLLYRLLEISKIVVCAGSVCSLRSGGFGFHPFQATEICTVFR